MLLRDEVRRQRDAILAAATEYGARSVRLFGSAARGDESATSDIDFLVTMERGRTLLDLARLESRLESILGRQVDLVTEDALQATIRGTVLREAVDV